MNSLIILAKTTNILFMLGLAWSFIKYNDELGKFTVRQLATLKLVFLLLILFASWGVLN